MRSQKSGTIVNVSSTAGFDGQPGVALYSTTKFALEGMTVCDLIPVLPFPSCSRGLLTLRNKVCPRR